MTLHIDLSLHKIVCLFILKFLFSDFLPNSSFAFVDLASEQNFRIFECYGNDTIHPHSVSFTSTTDPCVLQRRQRLWGLYCQPSLDYVVTSWESSVAQAAGDRNFVHTFKSDVTRKLGWFRCPYELVGLLAGPPPWVGSP